MGGFVSTTTVPQSFCRGNKVPHGTLGDRCPVKTERFKYIKRGSHPSRKAKRFKTNMAFDANGVEIVEAVDPIAEKDKEITKLKSDLENYKNVALKRLGKLPGDADFVAGVDEKTGLTVEETVRKTLIEQNLLKTESERNSEIAKLTKENNELRLAAKNKPSDGLGGGGEGGGPAVKDNVFTEAQIADLTKRAQRIGADPEKFIQNAKENLLRRR